MAYETEAQFFQRVREIIWSAPPNRDILKKKEAMQLICETYLQWNGYNQEQAENIVKEWFEQ